MASFPEKKLGKPTPEMLNQSGFNDARNDRVVVASVGPYANHLYCQTNNHASTSSFTGQMLFLMPNQQCESTGKSTKGKQLTD